MMPMPASIQWIPQSNIIVMFYSVSYFDFDVQDKSNFDFDVQDKNNEEPTDVKKEEVQHSITSDVDR